MEVMAVSTLIVNFDLHQSLQDPDFSFRIDTEGAQVQQTVYFLSIFL